MSAITASRSGTGAAGTQLRRQMSDRRAIAQVGRIILILLLLITAVVYLIVPVLAINFLQTPFIGTFLEYPIAVNHSVLDPFFPQSQQTDTNLDLAQDDQIIAVEGQPVNRVGDVYRHLDLIGEGNTVTLTVIDANGIQRERAVLLQPMPANLIFSIFAVPYVAGLVYIGIGMWVFRNRRTQPVGRLFLMSSLSLAIVLGTTFDLWTTHVFSFLWTLGFPMAGAFLLTFAFVFPTETPFIARRPWLRFLPLIPAAPFLIYAQLMVWFGPRNLIVLAWRLQYALTGVLIGAMLLMMLSRSLLAASPAVREQSRVILGGAGIAFLPFLIFAIQQTTPAPGSIGPLWIALGTILFPVAIAYSILQYSVLDTDRMLSFTATYTLMAIIVMLGYAVVIAGLNLILTASLAELMTSPATLGLFTFLLVLGFQPARVRLQRSIDDLFFRSRSQYEDRLTSFRQNLTAASGLGEIVRLLKTQVRETLMPTHIYVFLRDAHTGEFIAHGEGSRPDTDIRFETQSGLVHALSTTREVIFLEYNKPLPPELVDDHARLAVLRTPILATLQGQERLAGWVAVGARRSGQQYSIQDIRFIQALAEQASLAVERAQVIGDLERRVRELDVLSQVSQAVNFSTDPDVLMELIYSQTGKLIDTTNFYIVMHRPEIGGLSYAFFLEGHERYEDREQPFMPDNVGLESEVIRTGRPIRTDDYLAECVRRNVRPNPRSKHHSWMGVPLNAGNLTLGVMIAASYTPGVVFTDDQLKVFWAIADQAATALDKARLFRETENRSLQLQTLNEISKELSSTLDLENLLGRIMKSAVEILKAEAGSLFLVDEDSGELVFRVVEGGAQHLVGQRIPSGVGIVGQAAEAQEPIIVNDVNKDQRWYREVDQETRFSTESLLAVPLVIQDNSIGVLEVINKVDGSAFADDDIALLTTFAAQAAVAIENARLYEETDAALAARVDELQNLQRIDRELNRTLNFERVIQITLDWALRTTGASAGLMAMLTQEEDGLNIVSVTGYSQEFVESYRQSPIPLGLGIVGRVMGTGKAEFTPDVSGDPDYIDFSSMGSVSQITVPILRANQPIGMLALESHIHGLLTDADFEFIQRLVEHAAVAIENARLVQTVEQANRDKTEFISFVAHELKNPMTSIRGYTDLLKSGGVGPINEMQGNFLGTVRSNVDRMTRIVSDLSDVARLETNQLRLEMYPVSVDEIIDETVRGLQGQIDEKNQKLVVEIAENLPNIQADQTRIVQVMTNLLSNAQKYTPEEGTISIGGALITETDPDTGTVQDMIHHWVKDTGIGLSAEDLEKLFTKFFRADAGKEMAKGTGLGLVITKNLIERHGGRIWVESEVGVGTTFHFTIPVYKAEETRAEPASD